MDFGQQQGDNNKGTLPSQPDGDGLYEVPLIDVCVDSPQTFCWLHSSVIADCGDLFLYYIEFVQS